MEACKYTSALSGWVKLGLNSRCASWFLMRKAHDLCPDIAMFIEVCKASEVREFESLEKMW